MQSLVTCLDHRGIASDTVCSQARLCQAVHACNASTTVCLNVAHNVLPGEISLQRCSRQPSARGCIPFVSVSAFAEACSSMLSAVGLRQQALATKPCCAAHCSFGLWPLDAGRLGSLGQHRVTHAHNADSAVPGLVHNRRRLLQQQQDQHMLHLACKSLQNNSPYGELCSC